MFFQEISKMSKKDIESKVDHIYKYCDYGEVKKWDIKTLNKNMEDIDPDIYIKVIINTALDGYEEWGHPNPGICFFDEQSLNL